MKKIMNRPETLVREMLNGFVMAHPGLEYNSKYTFIKKETIHPNKVTLISGGGSGHEPAHAGFVGKGMLDVAVCGDVFASPSQIQVYQAIKASASSKGTLLIIKNYSGDVMNFNNAAHLASEDGIQVDYVKVDDDIAVEDSLYTVGRRGVAGTVLVHKIAGAAAEEGMSLEQVKAAAQNAIENVKSIGFALTSCTVPAKGSPTFALDEQEMEYGVGIHGEPGIRREKLLPADELAVRMVTELLHSLEISGNHGDEVAVLVNGFGGTPLQELYLLNNAVMRELESRKVKVYRVFVGNYMTSIDMAGASLSIMKLDAPLKRLLAEECDTPALVVRGPIEPVQFSSLSNEAEHHSPTDFGMVTSEEHAVVRDGKLSLNNLIYLLDKMSEIVIKNEVPFCELDSHAGDGDFGMSVAKGFRQLKSEWDEVISQANDIGAFLDACSLIIMEHCGGASGPIWGSGFRAAGKYAKGKKELTVPEIAGMMNAAVQGIQATGERSFGRGAVVGDKTLIDALVPYAQAWSKAADDGTDLITAGIKAAEAAVEGARKTESIAARMGRAGTVGNRSIGYPDAGAYALGVIFSGLAGSLKA